MDTPHDGQGVNSIGSAAVEEPPPPAGRLLLHMPVDVRSISLAIIATILSIYALQWAKEVIVPILAGVILSYALAPIVKRLERLRIPRAAGAAGLLCGILALFGWGASALGDQTDALIDTVPAVTERLRELSKQVTGRASTFQRVTRAADELTAAAGAPAAASAVVVTTPPNARGRTTQVIQAVPVPVAASPGFDVRGYLLTGTLGVAAFATKIAVIFCIALFILSSGNSFRRKMVKLAGKRMSQKKVTVETLDEINEQIQRYLLVQVAVSVVVGIFTGLAFWALGLHNAALWGVAAAVTNLIPYVGAVLVGVGAAVVALVQFGTLDMALYVGAASFIIHAIVGNLLTPWLTGRASKMSSVAVFITVLVFGWLWGVWGLLLGVPVLLVVKTVCDRVDDLKPIGEILGA